MRACATPGEALDALRALPCGARALDAFGAGDGVHVVGRRRPRPAAGPPPAEIDLVVEGDLTAAIAAPRRGPCHRPRPLRDRPRRGRRLRDRPRPRARERYLRPGRAARGRARLARGGPPPPRRDRQRDGARPRRASCARCPARSRTSQAGSCASSTTGRSLDDPTRLWRVARYAARLGFAVEPRTRALAHAADPSTVSGDRLGAELRARAERARPAGRAARRPRPPAPAAPGRLRPRPAGPAAALALLPEGEGRPDLLTLAAATAGMDARALLRWLDDMGFTAPDRDLVAAASRFSTGAPLRAARTPAQIARAARGAPLEAVALAGRRERAALDRRPAPRPPRDHGRRPPGRRDPAGAGGRRAPPARARPPPRRRDRRARGGTARRAAGGRLGSPRRDGEQQRPALGRRPRPLRGLVPHPHGPGNRDRRVAAPHAPRPVARPGRGRALARRHGPRRRPLRAQGDVPGRRPRGRRPPVPADPRRGRPDRPRRGRRHRLRRRVGAVVAAAPGPVRVRAPAPRARRRRRDRARCSPHADLQVSGTVRVGGRGLELDGARGGQAHLWGTRHAARWAWTHCNDLRGADGAPRAGHVRRRRLGLRRAAGAAVGPSTPGRGAVPGRGLRRHRPGRARPGPQPLRPEHVAPRGARGPAADRRGDRRAAGDPRGRDLPRPRRAPGLLLQQRGGLDASHRLGPRRPRARRVDPARRAHRGRPRALRVRPARLRGGRRPAATPFSPRSR